MDILPVVPSEGNLGTGAAFEQMVITRLERLERLEASQNRIEAAMPGMQQQSQTCNQTSSGRRSLRPPCTMSDVPYPLRLFCATLYRLAAKWHRLVAKLSRFIAKADLASNDSASNDSASSEWYMAEADRVQKDADSCEEIARCIKNGSPFCLQLGKHRICSGHDGGRHRVQ